MAFVGRKGESGSGYGKDRFRRGDAIDDSPLVLKEDPKGKVPPHDLEAEKAVLGAVLLDNAVFATVSATVVASDFYHPAHAVIFECMLALNARGEPIDIVSLSAELRSRERLNAVGGMQYLGELTETTPTVANAENHARIVADLAQVRRMISVAHDIVSRGYGARGSADSFLDYAAAQVFAVAQKRSKSTLIPLETAVQEAFERIEKTLERGARITGMESGFKDLDEMTSGMHPGQMIVIAARPAMGKCLTADAKVLLDDGRIATIEEIFRTRSGRVLTLGRDLRFRTTEPSGFIDDGVRPVFRVTTRLGRTVSATATHPFLTLDGWKSLGLLHKGERIAVPRVLPVFGDRAIEDARVIALGYLLGNGCLTDKTKLFTDDNPTLHRDFARAARIIAKSDINESTANARSSALDPSAMGDNAIRDVEATALAQWLDQIGLWGKAASAQFVPECIFTAPKAQVALFLNRLFATAGWVASHASTRAKIRYTTASDVLAEHVQHLLLRFGVIATRRKRFVKHNDQHRVQWQLDITDAHSIRTFAEQIGIFGQERRLAIVLMKLDSKHEQCDHDMIPNEVWAMIESRKEDESWQSLARRAGITETRTFTRERLLKVARALGDHTLLELATSEVCWDEIVSIEPLGEQQVYDLEIADTHNFVANDICVHNTSYVLCLTANAAKTSGKPVLFFSLEMPRVELVNRLLCAEANVDQSLLRSNMLTEEQMTALTNAASRIYNLPIYIDDSGELTLMDLRAKARRMKAERDLGLIVIDYLQLMKASREGMESREREISEISRGLKQLAKECDVPIVALSQLNRSVEGRTDKRPQLSDLRESGAIEQDADMVMFIYRDEVYNKNSEDKGIAEIIVAKQRNGPTGTVRLRFIRELTKFCNLEPDVHEYPDTEVSDYEMPDDEGLH